MAEQQDNYYIERVLNGESAVYKVLIDRYKDMAFTLAYRISRNREDAEEIIQDSYIKAYQNLGSFKQESKFSTWLYKIVYNTAISRYRKKKVDTEYLTGQETSKIHFDESSLNQLQHKERKIIIRSAIEKLREDESVVLTLFYLSELSIKEIEEITSYTNSNIKILLHRGRKNLLFVLKKLLKKEIIDLL